MIFYLNVAKSKKLAYLDAKKVRKCIQSDPETPEKNLIDQFSLSRQIVNGINVLNYPSKSLHLSALDIRIPPNSSLSLKAQNSLDF